MHLERRGVHQESWSNELLVLLMIAQDVTDVLAQEALDALSEFLDPVHVALVHLPGAVGEIRLPRFERLDLLFDAEIPRTSVTRSRT
jgi:hypothetical protein